MLTRTEMAEICRWARKALGEAAFGRDAGDSVAIFQCLELGRITEMTPEDLAEKAKTLQFALEKPLDADEEVFPLRELRFCIKG